MSHVTCHVPNVMCHVSNVIFFSSFLQSCGASRTSVEGLLSTRPIPSSFIYLSGFLCSYAQPSFHLHALFLEYYLHGCGCLSPQFWLQQIIFDIFCCCEAADTDGRICRNISACVSTLETLVASNFEVLTFWNIFELCKYLITIFVNIQYMCCHLFWTWT